MGNFKTTLVYATTFFALSSGVVLGAEADIQKQIDEV